MILKFHKRNNAQSAFRTIFYAGHKLRSCCTNKRSFLSTIYRLKQLLQITYKVKTTRISLS